MAELYPSLLTIGLTMKMTGKMTTSGDAKGVAHP